MKLTFEELTAVLTQVEARPFVALPADDDGIEVLTPGKFRPLEALPVHHISPKALALMALVCHFWQHWSVEYLNSLKRFSKL